MKSGVIANPGDLVTCAECSTSLYRVRNVLIRRTAIKAADFKSACDGMPEPDKRSDFAPCCKCGGAWWRFNADGVPLQLHFSDGWRPHAREEKAEADPQG